MPFDFSRPSSVTILPQTPTPLLDAWRLDAATAVRRSHGGSVSRHAVQSGREGITGAVELEPDTIAVTGRLVDTPISLGAFLEQKDRAVRMYDLLLKLRAERRALTFISSWTGALQNRWISSVDAVRSTATGRGIEISLTIDKLRIVRTQLVPQQLDTDIQLLGTSVVSVGEF